MIAADPLALSFFVGEFNTESTEGRGTDPHGEGMTICVGASGAKGRLMAEALTRGLKSPPPKGALKMSELKLRPPKPVMRSGC